MGRQIYHQDIERDEVSPMFFYEIHIFITTLIVVLALFSSFHWMLVLKGKTTLECCLNDQRYTPLDSWSQNLKIVFGTSNIIQIFMPKLSVLKNKGFSWGNISQERIQNTSMIEVQITNLETKKILKMKKEDEIEILT